MSGLSKSRAVGPELGSRSPGFWDTTCPAIRLGEKCHWALLGVRCPVLGRNCHRHRRNDDGHGESSGSGSPPSLADHRKRIPLRYWSRPTPQCPSRIDRGSPTEHGKTCQWGFRVSPDQTDMRAPCRYQSWITSLPASDQCAREADSGWLCSRKLQRPQRHMGSAFKRCQPLRHRRNEPAVCRCPS